MAKKMRRKRIRQALARERDELLKRGNKWQDICIISTTCFFIASVGEPQDQL